jgi:hypothetical protein
MVFIVHVTSGEVAFTWVKGEVSSPWFGKLFGFVKASTSTLLQKLG